MSLHPLLFLSFCAVTMGGATHEEFDSNQIVPDILSSGPRHELKVTYPSLGTISMGVEYRPSQTANAPTSFSFSSAKSSALYTLLMVDPDAPSRSNPLYRSWLHLMTTNMPGSSSGTLGDGDVVVTYNGPTPPQGTHRYVFLLFEQSNGKIRLMPPSKRGKFNVPNFVSTNQFNEPAAGTFFFAKP